MYIMEKNKRKRRTSTQKKVILSKCNKFCAYCGCTNKFLLNLDHIVPLSKGGKDEPKNIQATCRICNGLKADMTHSEFKKYLKILNNLADINKLTVTLATPTIKLKPYISIKQNGNN